MEKAHKEQLISSFHLKIRNSYYVQKAQIFRRFDSQYIELKKNIKTSKSGLVKPETIDERIENGFKNFIKSPQRKNR